MGARNRQILAIPAAVLASSALGYLNLYNDEVQLPLALLLVSTFVLGLLCPKRAWPGATIVALGIPASSLLSLKIGVFYPCRPGHPYSCEPTTLTSALSTAVLLVPALASAYVGVLINRSRANAPAP